jgi:hypothetical protein
MFFADPIKGFRNIGRALRPGGRLAFVCPQPFDRMDQSTIFAAIAEHVRLPDLSRSTGPSPLAFADPDTTRRVLAAADFDDVAVEGVEAPQYWARTPTTQPTSSSASARCATGCTRPTPIPLRRSAPGRPRWMPSARIRATAAACG